MIKNYIFTIIALFTALSSYAQIKEGIISYKIESVYGEPGWEEKLEVWRDTATSEAVLKTIDDTEKQIKEFLKRHEKPEDNRPGYVFYFDQKKARMLQKHEDLSNDYRIYDIDNLTHYNYRLKNGELKIDTSIWDREKISDWTINYEITVDSNDTKNILGFNCYKILVKDFKQKKGHGPVDLRHEIYITDEIYFPAHLIANWYVKLMAQCAMEIKTWNTDSPNNYSITTAVEFQKELDKSNFDIPNKFIKE